MGAVTIPTPTASVGRVMEQSDDLRTHNPKVAGSNPAPATKKALGIPTFLRVFSRRSGSLAALKPF